MRKFLKPIYSFINDMFISSQSLIMILFLSSKISVLNSFLFSKKNKRNNCIVLGNGPSLYIDIVNNVNLIRAPSDIFCVNFFLENHLFYEIRPNNYVLADNAFWDMSGSDELNDRIKILFNSLNKVSWEISLYVPYEGIRKIKRIINSELIQIIGYNRTSVNGFKLFRHFIYKLNLGMPKPSNVLNATVFLAVNNGYKQIFIFGADHSWISDIYINEKNEICSVQNHFYDDKKIEYVLPQGALSVGLRSIAEALDSYSLIKTYSDSLGCKIKNGTKKSFIDVFDKF